jgi:hypothetical protein
MSSSKQRNHEKANILTNKMQRLKDNIDDDLEQTEDLHAKYFYAV